MFHKYQQSFLRLADPELPFLRDTKSCCDGEVDFKGILSEVLATQNRVLLLHTSPPDLLHPLLFELGISRKPVSTYVVAGSVGAASCYAAIHMFGCLVP